MATKRPRKKAVTVQVVIKELMLLTGPIKVVEAKIDGVTHEGFFWPKVKAKYDSPGEEGG